MDIRGFNRAVGAVANFRQAVGLAALAAGLLAAATSWAQSVEQLAGELGGGDAQQRAAAADALGRLGLAARPALPQLIQALSKADDVELRWRTARAIGAIGGDQAVVEALTQRLGDEDARVRTYAAFALGRLGKGSVDAAPGLVKLAVDPDAQVRRAALEALRAIQPPRELTIPLFVKTLESARPEVLQPALHSLAEGGEAVVPALIEALKNDSAAYWACLILSEIGPPAAAATQPLVQVLKHGDEEVRLQALVALAEIGPAAAEAAPAITDRLQNATQNGVRYAAAYALGKIKPQDPAATRSLKQAAASDDAFLHLISSWALMELNPTDKKLVQNGVKAIVQGFQSEDQHVRRAAARAIAETTVPPEFTSPVMADAIRTVDESVIAEAVEALAALGETAVPRMIRGLENERVRPYAVAVIRRLGPTAKDAVPALIKTLRGSEPEYRREVHFALGAIGPDAAPAISELTSALSDSTDEVRYSACYALGKIGPAAKSAAPALRRLVSSDDEFQRLASVWALLKIEPGAPGLADQARPLLVQALDDEREHLRAEAAGALGDLGDAAREAIPALRKLSDDPSEIVRAAAADAIARIEAKAGTIQGSIVRARSGRAVTSLTFSVTLAGPGTSRKVDYRNGQFRFDDLKPGTYTVTASGQINGRRRTAAMEVRLPAGGNESVKLEIE